MRLLALRFVCLFSLSVWVGGFTFYSAVVIPVLHESLGSLETGYVTQQVTDYLNAAGAVAVAFWWLADWADHSGGPALARRARLGLLAATTVLLLGLIGLHRVMDGRLGSGGLRGSYPLHRAYLVVSTAQWFANLGLMAVTLVLRRHGQAGGRGSESPRSAATARPASCPASPSGRRRD